MLRALGFFCCALVAAPAGLLAVDDAQPPLIHQLTLQAGKFWGHAPYWYCRETLRQTGPAMRTGRLRFHLSDAPAKSPATVTREIVSWYGFSSFSENAESIHEIREVLTVDGKPAEEARSAEAFCGLLRGRRDFDKQALAEKFQRSTLTDAPSDFGQLIMLFTRRSIDRYRFHLTGSAMIGAQPVSVFEYRQETGSPGLHLDRANLPLAGTIFLRDDGAPLRITVVSSRRGKDKIEVRDEAEVEYEEARNGVLLPVSLVHRRLNNGAVASDDRAQYSDWKPIPEAQPK